jgi:lycopene cyclase domain-containing protein
MFILLLSLCLPFVLSFWPPLKFYRQVRALALTIFFVLIIFGSWDILAVRRNHWQFNPQGVWYFRFFGLPLEEVLFFIVIPFCCIFTWEAILYLKGRIK